MDKAYIQMLRVTSGQGSSSMAVDLDSLVCYDIISAREGTILAGPSQHKALSFCQSTIASVPSRAAGPETCQELGTWCPDLMKSLPCIEA